MTRLRFFTLGVVSLALMFSTTKAATVPLSDLVDGGGTIQSGDKLFSNFTYNTTGDMPGAADVEVITIEDDEQTFGIRFNGAFQDLAGGSASDALITFDVEVSDPNRQINGAHLRANVAVPIVAEGLASITETFLPDIDDEKLVVFDFGNGLDDLAESIMFDRTYSKLSVQKDIILHATGDQAPVFMSFVDQTFSQVIPEPSSGFLVISGFVGWMTLRRRRFA